MRIMTIAGLVGLVSGSAALAAPLTYIAPTNSGGQTASIDLFSGSTTYGTIAATGLTMNDGTANFIAWCFDLEHPISAGFTYDYNTTTTPYSNSTLTSGAVGRAQGVFDANFASVDAFDVVSSSAFQLALWEIAYDNDYDLSTGAFQASGNGTNAAAIDALAATYLNNALNYVGSQLYSMTFWEDNSINAGLFPTLPSDTVFQNLVSATPLPDPGPSPVPVPAAAPLMAVAIGSLVAVRRRKQG